MSHNTPPFARLAELLDGKVQRLTADAAQAQAAVSRLQAQVDRLQALSAQGRPEPLAGPLHRANAAGFRGDLIELAAHCRDELGAQRARHAAVQGALLSTAREHQVMQTLRDQAQLREQAIAARTEQKRQDDWAGQAWRRRAALAAARST
jgi:flagellar export protein FliJ